jgi:hypothetical protein
MNVSDFLHLMNGIQSDIHKNVVSKDPTYTKIIEIAFEVFDSFLKIDLKDNVELLAFQELVSRTYETLQAVTLLTIGGLAHSANSLLREIVELEYLFEYFTIEPDNFERWLNADEKTRKKEYKPWQLRQKIARGNAHIKDVLDKDYQGHSEYSTHITPNSIILRQGYKLKPHPDKYDRTLVESIFTDIAHHVYPIVQTVCLIGKTMTKDAFYDKKISELEPLIKKLDLYIMISGILTLDRLEAGLKASKSRD